MGDDKYDALRYAPMPPVGLRPKFIAQEHRLAEINAAISRYVDTEFYIPVEWIEERNEIIEALKKGSQ